MAEAESPHDVLKKSVKSVMKKMDMEIPIYVKINSDIYREYRHTVEDFFEIMSTIEQAELGWMLRDRRTQEIFNMWTRSYTAAALATLDHHDNFLKWYSEMRISGMKLMDAGIHYTMKIHDAYSAKPDASTTNTTATRRRASKMTK